jgi:hypothetical protein
VRVKPVGRRGTVEKINPDGLLIRFEDSTELGAFPADVVTNYSLAARKAWARMPDRRVGRPRGSRVCDRLSVTIRVDRSLWEQFRRYEHDGRIEDRTESINRWLRQKLNEIAENRDEAQAHN